jgi:hypothetical protein
MLNKLREKIKSMYNSNGFVVRHRRNKDEKKAYGKILTKEERVAIEQFNQGKIIKTEDF